MKDTGENNNLFTSSFSEAALLLAGTTASSAALVVLPALASDRGWLATYSEAYQVTFKTWHSNKQEHLPLWRSPALRQAQAQKSRQA